MLSGGLVVADSRVGFFLDKQKAAIAFGDGGNGHMQIPGHGSVIGPKAPFYRQATMKSAKMAAFWHWQKFAVSEHTQGFCIHSQTFQPYL